MEALTHLQQLQQGTLVFVLKSDAKKREALQTVIDHPNTSSSQRKRAEKQLKTSIRDKHNFHSDLVKALRQTYTFSDYRLIYDNDLTQFMTSFDAGNLLTDELKRDERITLTKTKPVYYAKEEYTDYASSSRVLSYVIYDENNEQTKAPFPTVKVSNLGPAMLIKSIFNKSDYRDGIVIAERLDYMLKHRMATLSNEEE